MRSRACRLVGREVGAAKGLGPPGTCHFDGDSTCRSAVRLGGGPLDFVGLYSRDFLLAVEASQCACNASHQHYAMASCRVVCGKGGGSHATGHNDTGSGLHAPAIDQKGVEKRNQATGRAGQHGGAGHGAARPFDGCVYRGCHECVSSQSMAIIKGGPRRHEPAK